MDVVWNAGVRNITFDTYSYSAHNPGIRSAFINAGFDFDRMFLLGADSQAIGSLLLKEFMEIFREKGFSCSTFDLGNVPRNDQAICCEVGDWFPDAGYNWGCAVGAVRFIRDRGATITGWRRFKYWVNSKGGFLTPTMEQEVHGLWNNLDGSAYSVAWSAGLAPMGRDADGIVWSYLVDNDHRKNTMEVLSCRSK
jgi:hypothetical protein